jgi:hypothetical protein
MVGLGIEGESGRLHADKNSLPVRVQGVGGDALEHEEIIRKL